MKKKTKIMGILNVTPDSFSDGGLYNKPEMAVKKLEAMLLAKSDIIDIGAVSTRAYKDKNTFPSVREELDRFKKILPSIAPILKNSKVEISIDSFNPSTIEYLLDKIPVAIINDQAACSEPQMIDLIKNTNLKISIMHHLDIPADPSNIIPESLNVVEVVKEWLLKKAEYLISQGIKQEQIILDPGIGFGKSAAQSWQIIKEASAFTSLGYSVLYGHSRKSFLNMITDKSFAERDLETAILSKYLADAGVDYLRVHDIEANLRAVRISEFMSEIKW